MSGLQPPGSNEALRITDAAPSLDAQAVFEGFTGIEHRRWGKRGGPRSQPYTVWLEGKIVYFSSTKEEATNVLGRELRKSRVDGAVR